MNIKKILSGALAGIMAITSSVASISPTAFAADDSTWDLPMLPADGAAQTVIDSQSVNGWNSFDVDLRPFGMMNQFTTVTITCVTEKTEIVGEDGEAPEAAFGVVINNNWDKATMPRCTYDSNKTVFEMTLTAEQLENNPVFKVQSQLPVRALFTVTVSNLTPDDRKALSLAPLSENVTVNTYDASDWMNGGNCFGSVSIPADKISCDYDITYGETTVSQLRENVKYISTSAIPYYGDSLDAGADAFNYNVAIVCGNGVVVSTMSSEDSFDLTSPGTTYIDSLCTDELDSFVVYEIKIEISAKLFWNGEISKNQAVSDKIRLAEPNKPIQLEIAYDPRIALPLPAVDKYSMVLTAGEGDGWLIGSYAYADYIVPDPVGKTYGNTTIGDLRKVLKKFNTTANTYLSDSLNAGEDNFEYRVELEAKNGEECIRFGNDSFRLTESGAVYVDNFDYNGTKISSGTYDDYVITAIIIKVQSALGWNDVEKKSFALCEDIRNMKPGDTLTLNLKEDTREDVKTEVTDTSVNMGVWTDSWLDGVTAAGSTSTLTIPGITYGTTKFEDVKETIRSLNVTVPYFSDTLKAGKDAFVYKFVIEFADGDTWWGGNYADLGESLTQLIDNIDVSEFADTTIARVYINIEAELEDAGNGRKRTVSEVIRAQKEETGFTIDLVQKDTRPQNVKATAGDKQVTLTWDAVEGATKYATYSYLNGKYTSAGQTTGTTMTVKNLTNGTKYGFLVIAYVNGAWSSYTTADLVYATPEGPSKPVFTATPGNGQVTLNWNAVSGATKYATYYYLNGKYTSAGQTTGTSLTVKGLTNGTKYGFLVIAYVGGAWTSYTTADLVYATPVGYSKPKFTATPGDGQVTLNWSAVSGATKYATYSYLNGKYTSAGQTTATSLTVKNLTNGTKYGFLVIAYVDGAWTSYTTADLVYATPVGSSKPKFTATAGDGQVTLNWSAVSGATKYATYYYINGKYTAAGQTTGTSLTVKNLTNGTKYGFLVIAYVNGAWSSFSTADLVYATPVASNKPVFTATAGDGQVTLNWSAVSGATKYATYSYLNGKYTSAGQTTGTSLTVKNLTNGTKYGFLVIAYVNGAWTPYTTADLVYATPVASSKPKFTATPGDGQVTLNWSAVSGATKYATYYYLNGKYTAAGQTTGTSLTVKNLTNGTEYGFLVIAYVNGAWTSYTTADLVYATPTE